MASGSPWGAFCGTESQLIGSVSSCSSVQSIMALRGVGLRFEAWQSSNPGSCTWSAIQSTSHLFCSPRTMGTRGKRDDGDLLADTCNRSQQCHMRTGGMMMVMNRSKKRRNSIGDSGYVARVSNHLLLSLSSSRTCLPYLRQFTYPSSCQPGQGRVYTNEWPPVPAKPWRMKRWHGVERVGGVGKAFLEVGSHEEIWYWGRMALSLYSLGGISVSAGGKTILAARISPSETCWSYRSLSENQGRQVRARLGRHRSLCPRCSSSISTGPNQGASLATPEAEQHSTGSQARPAGRGIGGVWDRDEGDWASYRTHSLMSSKLAAPTALPPVPPTPTDSSIFSVMPYLWKLAASHSSLRWRLFLALALLFLGKIAGLAGPLLFKKAVDALTIAQTSTAAPPIGLAISCLILSCVVKAVSSVFNELRYVLFAPVSHATGRQVALHFFEHVMGMDMAFHLERKTGSLAKILDRGKRSVSMIFRAVVFTFVPTIVELVLVCGLLAKNVSPLFASIVFVTFMVYVLWTILLTQAAAASRKQVNVLDNLTTGKAVDALLNYETVMQFNNQSLESAQYNGLLHGYQQASIEAEYIMSLMNAGQATILAMGTGLIMALAGIRVFHGTMTVGDLVLANGLVLQLSLPLQFLGFWYRDVRQSLVDMENMFDLLGTKSTLKDGTDILPYEERGAEVHVRDVRFGYNESREVLRGVSFSVSSGQSIAIVGTSGSGKSTIVKLLLRLFDPTAGVVTIDGYDVRSLKQESLRSAAALVPQDTVLFNDTIFHNISYGRPDATDNEVIDAAKKAHLHQAIMRMPDQYNTVVGERGIKLSGGEKQRVAIARAFLKSPRLLICDEATSALDSATESAILKSLKELASGRTCVFVAHRLSTIKHCDHILVMEMGQVIEEGSHSELIARNGRYTHMWAMQEMERPLRLYAKEDAKDDGSYNVDSSINGPLRQLSDDEDDDILSSVDVEVDTNLLDVDDLISRDDARGDLENYHRGEGGGSGSSNLKLINE